MRPPFALAVKYNGRMSVDIGTRIERTPGAVGGRPRIAGTRISVDHVARRWHWGYSPDELVDRVFTHVSLEGVCAALAYYFANRAEVDGYIAEEDALIEQMIEDHPERIL